MAVAFLVFYFMYCICQILQVNKSPVDKMSSDCLIHNLRSATLLELTVRFNLKGILKVFQFII